jgi:hemerythrin superfamily protein
LRANHEKEPFMASRRSSSVRSGRRAARSPSRRRRAPRAERARKPEAIGLLKEDHRRVEALFTKFGRTKAGSQKERIASSICRELKAHAQLEEEIFYPAARVATAANDLLNEAEVEHATAKDLIRQIEGSSPSDDHFDALVTVLGEYVRHHVKEEEGEMFKQVRASGLDLRELGERMQKRKRELAKEGSEKGLLGSFLGG